MQQLKSSQSYPKQLCLETGFVLTDIVSADKSFPDFFMQGISICVNSYLTKYLSITVDHKTHQGLPFNHVINCGWKIFDVIPLDVAATTKTQLCKDRRPHSIGQ